MSKFARRSLVYRSATEVSGQRQRLTTSTAHSTKTIAMSQAVTRFSPSQEANGITIVQPAKRAQTIVCAALIVLRAAERAAVGGCSCVMKTLGGFCMDRYDL